MAKVKAKAAKAGGAAAVSTVAPYAQRLVSDEELRDNLKAAYDSARVAYGRLSNGKGPATALLDDKKLQRELSSAATSLKEASDALRGGKRKKRRRRRGGLGTLLLLGIVGTGVALGVSEGLRNKVLDALFGAEEEFDYQSTTAPTSSPPTEATTTS